MRAEKLLHEMVSSSWRSVDKTQGLVVLDAELVELLADVVAGARIVSVIGRGEFRDLGARLAELDHATKKRERAVLDEIAARKARYDKLLSR